MSLWFCMSVFNMFVVTVTLLTCGSKGSDDKEAKDSGMPKTGPAPGSLQGSAQAPPAPEPPKKDAMSNEPKEKEKSKIKSVKEAKPAAKGASKMDKAPGAGDDNGYETCPDMSPEELAKIAGAK